MIVEHILSVKLGENSFSEGDDKWGSISGLDLLKSEKSILE